MSRAKTESTTTPRFRLLDIERDLRAKLALIENEISLRRASSRSETAWQVFALDFDVIYDFIHPQSDLGPRRSSAAAVDGLLQSEALRISLLPGTVFEFLRFFFRIRDIVPSVSNVDDLLARLENDSRPTFADLDLTHRLRTEVSRRLQLLQEHRVIIRLALEFLAAAPLIGLEEAGLAKVALSADPSLARSLFRELRLQRVGRDINNRIDSLNLAIVLRSGEAGFALPLVTKSSRLRRACTAVIADGTLQSLSTNLIWGPQQVLFALSVEHVTENELLRIREELVKMLPAMQDYIADPSATTGGVADALSTLEETVRSQLALSGLLDRTARRLADFRQSLTIDTPEDIDVRATGMRLLQMAKDTRRGIESAVRRLSRLIGSGQQAMEATVGDSPEWRGIAKAGVLLHDCPQRPAIVIQRLEKLVIIESGGTMSDYRVSQKGKNITAIVDSFKLISANAAGVLGSDAHKMLDSLVEAVAASEMPAQEKEDALTGLTEVVETVQEQGRLAATAKLIWRGLRETIKLVPDAIRAWEALDKLWK